MNPLPTIDGQGFARDPIADGLASLDFHPWEFEKWCRSENRNPERHLAQLLSIVRADVRENAADSTPLPKPTGEVWTDREELVASLRAARRSPERYLADAERLLDFPAHVAAIEARATREGLAGDAGLAAFIAERRASGADSLSLFVAIRRREFLPADEALRRVFRAARERCEHVREYVPGIGPIPAEPPSVPVAVGPGEREVTEDYDAPEPSISGAIIVEAIAALRQWVAEAAATLRRRSGDGPTRTPAVLLCTSDAAARVHKTRDAIRKASERHPDKLREYRKPGDREVYFDRDELDRYFKHSPD